MDDFSIIRFLNEWKVIDRSLAIVFVFYAHILTADLDRMSSQFQDLSDDLKTLNIQMIKVVERTSTQKEAIAEHKRLIEKNADEIQDIIKTKTL